MGITFLAALKDKLVQATEFSDVWKFFLDNFGEDPTFMALGERTSHGLLEALIVQAAKGSFKMTIEPKDILLTLLPEQKFIHGGICRNGKMINVLYFDEISTGCMMICAVGAKNTITSRFIAKPAGPSLPQPSLN